MSANVCIYILYSHTKQQNYSIMFITNCGLYKSQDDAECRCMMIVLYFKCSKMN